MDVQCQLDVSREDAGCITSSRAHAKYYGTDLVIDTLDEFATFWAGPTANCIADYAFNPGAVAAHA